MTCIVIKHQNKIVLKPCFFHDTKIIQYQVCHKVLKLYCLQIKNILINYFCYTRKANKLNDHHETYTIE